MHVGTGEEMSPLDYVVYEKKFYPLNQEQMMRLVKHFRLEREFAEWVHDGFAAMAKAGDDNRVLADARNNLNPYQFFYTRGKKHFDDFLKTLHPAKGHLVKFDDQTARRYQGQKNAVLGQVRAAIKTGADQAAYLPGTTLKGALRTAVFYQYLRTYGDTALIAKTITDQLNKKVRKEQFALPLIHEAFYCGQRDKEGRYNGRDEKMDLFKLVTFSDASLDQRNSPLQLAKFNIYLVEKERNRPGSTPVFRAAMQSQASYCETIGTGQTLRALLNFDIDFLLQIKKWLKNGSVGDQWIGIEAKVKKLFNLDLQSLNEDNRQQKRDEVIAHLMASWHDFSQRQRQRQQTWLNNFLLHDKEQHFTKAKQGFEQIKVADQQFLLHLGYATGFLGTTALIYFLEDNSPNQQFYQKALERFGIGNRPGNRGDYQLNLGRFPKSRRLIDDNGVQVMPGWLALATEPIPNEVQATGTGSNQLIDLPPIIPVAAPKEIKAEFPSRPLKGGQQVNLDAVVVASGRPNRVRVYVKEGDMPEFVLNGYRSELEVGSILNVRASLNKKVEIVQVDYLSVKK